MNYKKEPYPENVLSLLNNAEVLATEIIEKLNAASCKKINELYYFERDRIKRNEAFFNALGYSPNAYLKTKSKKIINNEFKGLYIFGDEFDGKIIPVYVGISRSVFRRLKQHAWGKKHNECSLAYLKSKNQFEIEEKVISRATITNEDMLPAKTIIQNYKVVLVEVQNDYDLYFLEVALAGIFSTKWNSFKTH
ncbi:hypothetical protein ACFSX9_02110 [Flavobacterium ardleyense]|uniref:GIY-YIG domain-containing protein n=1 Tax=Flavobacterium ardleyense TaxID=2038737 RepID=A0ABW5Z599_9FLAO